MGIASYVINFNELVKLMLMEKVEIEVDTQEIQDILNQYFPEILNLLEEIRDETHVSGVQKIKGFATNGQTVVFTPDHDILLTGVTFSQNTFDRHCFDRWSVKIQSGGEEIALLDGVYAKDALQHKYFEKYYPVPAGYHVVIELEKVDNYEATYWFDLEYLELNGHGNG